MGISDRIKEVEEEIGKTQKNKATEYHLGILKAKLQRLKTELTAPKGPTSKGKGWEVSKSGDARACLIGFPSVGKSTFLSIVTNTFSKQAEHEFTTVDCIAGVMSCNGGSIQLLDLPGIIDGASSNKGRGRQILSTAKTADVIIMMLDYRRPNDKEVLTNELYKMGVRLNRKKPNITLTATGKGTQGKGLDISATVRLTKISEETIKGILRTYKIHNCQLTVREDITSDDLIDILCGSVAYIPCVYVFNKVDELTIQELNDLPKDASYISCSKKWNIDGFRDDIWYKLNFIRIYTKRKGKSPDFNEPVIMRNKPTIKDLCKTIHKSFYIHFRHAFTWGRSSKHAPQKVGLNHVLQDEDVVQLFAGR